MAKLDLIISDLRRRISEAGFRPGDMIPTQKELAQEMGVSVVTVGQAVRYLQEEGVLASTRGKGTMVNGHRDSKPSSTIGLLMSSATLNDPVLRPPLTALQEACERAGRILKTFIFDPVGIQREQLRDWAKEVSACVVLGSTKPDFVRFIGSLGKPVVFHGELYRESCPAWASQITVSVEMISSLSLQFLNSLGHQRVLLVRSRGASYLESLGLQFERAAKELECELEQLIVPFSTDGGEVFDYLQNNPFHPSALIVDGGMRASRVLHTLTSRGVQIPKELSLLAINGVSKEYLITPHLSRVENLPRRLGEKILSMIDQMMERGVVMREETISSLVWGKTCAPLLKNEDSTNLWEPLI